CTGWFSSPCAAGTQAAPHPFGAPGYCSSPGASEDSAATPCTGSRWRAASRVGTLRRERGDVTPRDSCSSLPEPWARRPQALPRAWRSADTTGLSLRSGPAVDGNADAGAAPGISAHCALSVRGAGPVPCVESLLWRSLSDTHVALPEASLRAPVASLRFELAHQPGRMCGETASGPPSRKAAPSRAE